MKTKIIAVTMPFQDTGMDNPVDLISYCARVSNPANQDKFDTAPKLLAYLAKHQHWSPFEMVNVVFEIETTRDIARQILRHRSFSFQEFSQRYAEVAGDPECREARLQDTKNRQNSIDVSDENLQEEWYHVQEFLYKEAQEAYKWALDRGIAKEVARAVLPEGMTMSRLYMNGTLRSWIHYCQLRMGNGTQKEHREIANEIWETLCSKFMFLREIAGEMNATN